MGKRAKMIKRPSFELVLQELLEMQSRKGKDYGRDSDPLANLVDAETFGIPAWIGTMIRANDKMSRIKTFVRRGELANESVEDSLIDLAVYTIHALRLYREVNSKVDPKKRSRPKREP